jgi:hypothetical protein
MNQESSVLSLNRVEELEMKNSELKERLRLLNQTRLDPPCVAHSTSQSGKQSQLLSTSSAAPKNRRSSTSTASSSSSSPLPFIPIPQRTSHLPSTYSSTKSDTSSNWTWLSEKIQDLAALRVSWYVEQIIFK